MPAVRAERFFDDSVEHFHFLDPIKEVDESRQKLLRLRSQLVRLKGEFNEQDHPRADNGQFGSGGGGGAEGGSEEKPSGASQSLTALRSHAQSIVDKGGDYGDVAEALGTSKLAAQYLVERDSDDKPNMKLPDTSRPELDIEERAEVWDYTREAYEEMNSRLRRGASPDSFPLQAIINKADEFPDPVTVRRGIDIEDDDELEALLESFRNAAEAGEMVEFPGFTSTAATGGAFPGNVQLEILARKGLDASNYTGNAGELLLAASSNFRVLSVKGTRIKLEQVL